MVQNLTRYKTLFLLTLGILVVFIGRTRLAAAYPACSGQPANLYDPTTWAFTSLPLGHALGQHMRQGRQLLPAHPQRF